MKCSREGLQPFKVGAPEQCRSLLLGLQGCGVHVLLLRNLLEAWLSGGCRVHNA